MRCFSCPLSTKTFYEDEETCAIEDVCLCPFDDVFHEEGQVCQHESEAKKHMAIDTRYIARMIHNKEIASIKLWNGTVILAEDIKEIMLPDGTVELV